MFFIVWATDQEVYNPAQPYFCIPSWDGRAMKRCLPGQSCLLKTPQNLEKPRYNTDVCCYKISGFRHIVCSHMLQQYIRKASVQKHVAGKLIECNIFKLWKNLGMHAKLQCNTLYIFHNSCWRFGSMHFWARFKCRCVVILLTAI